MMNKEPNFSKRDTISGVVGSPSRVLQPLKMDDIEKKVRILIEDDMIYLDPEMSLQKLSSMTGTNATYLSNTINDCFGCNFRTLLNKYRVGYAKLQISNEGGFMKDIYKKCGFVSRSAFYRSFKEVTGLTPLKFLRQVISDNGHYRKYYYPY